MLITFTQSGERMIDEWSVSTTTSSTNGKEPMVDIECPDCGGIGRVEDEYQVGGYGPDPWVEVRVKWVECETCGGWGEIKSDD